MNVLRHRRTPSSISISERIENIVEQTQESMIAENPDKSRLKKGRNPILSKGYSNLDSLYYRKSNRQKKSLFDISDTTAFSGKICKTFKSLNNKSKLHKNISLWQNKTKKSGQLKVNISRLINKTKRPQTPNAIYFRKTPQGSSIFNKIQRQAYSSKHGDELFRYQSFGMVGQVSKRVKESCNQNKKKKKKSVSQTPDIENRAPKNRTKKDLFVKHLVTEGNQKIFNPSLYLNHENYSNPRMNLTEQDLSSILRKSKVLGRQNKESTCPVQGGIVPAKKGATNIYSQMLAQEYQTQGQINNNNSRVATNSNGRHIPKSKKVIGSFSTREMQGIKTFHTKQRSLMSISQRIDPKTFIKNKNSGKNKKKTSKERLELRKHGAATNYEVERLPTSVIGHSYFDSLLQNRQLANLSSNYLTKESNKIYKRN